MGIASFDPVSRVTVARAAMANTDFTAARAAMAPLIAEGQRPTVRMCLLMAEMEEAEHGDIGQWREWLARAARAPLDPVWVADGIVYERWEPTSPTSGRLDAFRWQVPAERLGPAMEAMPAPLRRDDTLIAAPMRDEALPPPATPEDVPATAPWAQEGLPMSNIPGSAPFLRQTAANGHEAESAAPHPNEMSGSLDTQPLDENPSPRSPSDAP